VKMAGKTTAEYVNTDNTFLPRYVTGPVQWDRRLNDRTNSEDGLSRAQHYPKTVSQGSAELFYLDYVEEFDEEPT
jgi:hypothetical protein